MRTDILRWADLPEKLRARKVFASQDRPSLDKYLRATAVHTHILLPELCPTRAASALGHTLGAGAILTPHYFCLQIETISQLCIFIGLEVESKVGRSARRAALLRKGGASWRACGSPAVCDQFSSRFLRPVLVSISDPKNSENAETGEANFMKFRFSGSEIETKTGLGN